MIMNNKWTKWRHQWILKLIGQLPSNRFIWVYLFRGGPINDGYSYCEVHQTLDRWVYGGNDDCWWGLMPTEKWGDHLETILRYHKMWGFTPVAAWSARCAIVENNHLKFNKLGLSSNAVHPNIVFWMMIKAWIRWHTILNKPHVGIQDPWTWALGLVSFSTNYPMLGYPTHWPNMIVG